MRKQTLAVLRQSKETESSMLAACFQALKQNKVEQKFEFTQMELEAESDMISTAESTITKQDRNGEVRSAKRACQTVVDCTSK